MKLTWTDDLLTGLGIIDDQHQQLFLRIASFVEAVDKNDSATISDTIDYLIGYTIQHFGAEEFIMIKHCYDDFKTHRDEHSRFIKQVYEAKKQITLGGMDQEFLKAFRTEMVDWLVSHIKVKDKRIARTIKM